MKPGQEDEPLAEIESEEEKPPPRARGLHVEPVEHDPVQHQGPQGEGHVDHIAHLVGRGRLPFRIGRAGARGVGGRGYYLPVQPPEER
jgi:hypothetical protein